MPLYGFVCECGEEKDVFFHMNDEKRAVCDCGNEMKRVYSISVKPDIQPYYDHALGWVKNRRDKELKMKEKGIKYFEPSEFKKHESYEGYAEGVEKAKFEYRKKGKSFYDIKV